MPNKIKKEKEKILASLNDSEDGSMSSSSSSSDLGFLDGTSNTQIKGRVQKKKVKKGSLSKKTGKTAETPAVKKEKKKSDEVPAVRVQKKLQGASGQDGIPAEKPTLEAKQTFIQSIINGIQSKEYTEQLTACLQIQRPRIEIPFSELGDILISSNVVPRLVNFLQDNENGPQLQNISLWIILNLTAGSEAQTASVVNSGAIPLLIHMLSFPRSHIADMAAWALGNIAGEGRTNVEKLLAAGILNPLIKLGKRQKQELINLKTVGRVIAGLSRFSHNSPFFPTTEVFKCVPILTTIIQNGFDLDFIYEACWGIFYLTINGHTGIIEELMLTGVVQKIVEILDYKNVDHKIIEPALKTVGNIVSSKKESHTDTVIRAGLLNNLSKIILRPEFEYVSTWIVSNIAGGNSTQRDNLFDSGFLPLLINILQQRQQQDESVVPSQIQATYAIANIIKGGSLIHIRFLQNHEVIPLLIDQCTRPNAETLVITSTVHALSLMLRAIENVGNDPEMESFVKILIKCDGLNKLQKLQRDLHLGSTATVHLDYISVTASRIMVNKK